MASDRGPPTSTCCSASATPTPGRPATSHCRRRRGCVGARGAADDEGDGPARRGLATVARRGRLLLWSYYRAHKQREGAPVSRQPKRRTMAELDGPRLEPRAAARAPARGVPARLRRRRQRPDRDRPRLAGAAAARGLRLAACAGALRTGADGTAVVPAHLSRSRTSAGSASTRRRRCSSASSTPSSSAATCRPRHWRWSASARAR